MLADDKNPNNNNEMLKNSVHIFSCLFYSKLTETCPAGSLTGDYELVEKWCKSTDIFSKKLLLVPINEGSHWSLTAIINPGKVVVRNIPSYFINYL